MGAMETMKKGSLFPVFKVFKKAEKSCPCENVVAKGGKLDISL